VDARLYYLLLVVVEIQVNEIGIRIGAVRDSWTILWVFTLPQEGEKQVNKVELVLGRSLDPLVVAQ
jgi:hypothetical protein